MHICPLHKRSSETTRVFARLARWQLYAPIHNRATPYINAPRTSPLFFAGSIRTRYGWYGAVSSSCCAVFGRPSLPDFLGKLGAFFWSEARFDLIQMHI